MLILLYRQRIQAQKEIEDQVHPMSGKPRTQTRQFGRELQIGE